MALSALSLFLFAACSSGDGGGVSMTQSAQGRFLALGDSYTIGESVPPSERWPVQLAGLLRDAGVPVQDPEIIARTGWTTDELSAGVDAAAPSGPYELVSLLIGVNNQYRGRSADEYRAELRGLIGRAIGFAGDRPQRVVVLSIPDWGVTPFAEGRDREQIAREIDAYNAIKREEALRAGVHFVDVASVSRTAATNARLTAEDGLHPSGVLYAEWARLALPAALAALRSGS